MLLIGRVCGFSLTVTAAASACAFRMLLFRSSGVRMGVAPGLLLAGLLRLHFSVIFTTSSYNNRATGSSHTEQQDKRQRI